MRFLALFFWLCAGPVAALDAFEKAEAARADLTVAASFLSTAKTAQDRIAALAQAVRAYEQGLSALRESLREAAQRERHLANRLNSQNAEVEALLAALVTLRPGTSPEAFLHPKGINGAVRAGLLLSDTTPALAEEALQLRDDLEDARAVTELQRDVQKTLETGLLQVQGARLALHQAVAQRTDLPFRFIADARRAQQLVASVDSLGAFAEGLGSFATDDLGWMPVDLDTRIGKLELPAKGHVLLVPGQPDSAGVARDGITLGTPRGALVTSPVEATLRYVGPLLNMGQVVILEPRSDILIIVSGLDMTYGEAGQIVPEGAPLGLMGGLQADFIEIETSTGGEKGGAPGTEALYIEVRRDNIPQDPTRWFRIDKDG